MIGGTCDFLLDPGLILFYPVKGSPLKFDPDYVLSVGAIP